MALVKQWILLRGLGREQRHWGGFVKACQRQFPEVNFICLDLPGCGEYCQQSSPLSIMAIRQHLQQQLLAKNIRGQFGIIGLSLGGMVALDWLAAEPDAVAKVVVINSSVNNVPLYQRLLPSALPLLACAFLANHHQREAHILKLVSRYHYYDSELLQGWQAIQHSHPVSRTTLVRQLLAAAAFSLPLLTLEDLTKRGMVLCSDQDSLVSPRCSQTIASDYQWPLHVTVEGGHDLPVDNPEWLLERMQNFL